MPARGGRQELVAVLGLQVRRPLTLQSPSDGRGRGQGSNEDVVVTGQPLMVANGRFADLVDKEGDAQVGV